MTKLVDRIFPNDERASAVLPLYAFKVPAGFPSPAADHIEKHISLDELFEIRAPHIHSLQMQGDGMTGVGLYDGDLMIVDSSRDAESGDIVMATLNDEPLCRRLGAHHGWLILQPASPHVVLRPVDEGDELVITGVVRYSVRQHEKVSRSARHVSLDALFQIREPHVYLVKISGDSMQGAGIFDGDLAIVDRSRDAEHGHIVIAALNDQPLCKRLYQRDDVLMLQSENSKYPPRHVMECDELAIWGVVTYSIRDHEKA